MSPASPSEPTRAASESLDSSKRDGRGAYKHAPYGRMVVPPAWNMTPSEYRALAVQVRGTTGADAFFAVASVIAPLVVSCLIGWGLSHPMAVMGIFENALNDAQAAQEAAEDTALSGLLAKDFGDAPTWLASLLSLMSVLMVFTGCFTALSNARRNLPDVGDWLANLGHHPPSMLDTLDPAEALSIDDLPDEIAALVYYLADDHGVRPVPSERAERLIVAYETTRDFHTAIATTCKPTIATLVRETPEALERLLTYCETPVGGSRGFSDKHRVSTITAIRSTLAIGRPNERENNTGSATTTPTPDPTPSQPYPEARQAHVAVEGDGGQETRVQRWAKTVARHDAITDEWADIVADPLAALDHSLLLDVTQPRTAKFIETYGRAQDLRSLHGTAFPDSTDVLADYLSTVRQADEAWQDAQRHARHIHLSWLPENEAKWVRQASALLASAADESQPIHLRADSAAQAAKLLAKVTSFYLPKATAAAIETKARLALPAGPNAGGPILSAPEQQNGEAGQAPTPRQFIPMDGTVY